MAGTILSTRRDFLGNAGRWAGGASLSPLIARRRALGARAVGLRRDITQMDAAELQRFRDAMRGLQSTAGASGFDGLAGLHGFPSYQCPHRSLLFLAWHRAYIWRFEQALQAIEPGVTLPFWDWTSTVAFGRGIPEAFSLPEYTNSAGMRVANPLFSFRVRRTGARSNRAPRASNELRVFANQVSRAFSARSYSEISWWLENPPHDNLHGWVGGSMGRVDDAAYDPLFWSHHANVDRQWAAWQSSANNADPTPAQLNWELRGLGMRVRDVVDYRGQLGYEYEGISQQGSGGRLMAQGYRDSALLAPDANGLIQLDHLDFDELSGQVELIAEFKPDATGAFTFDVFLDDPTANTDTPRMGPSYAGSFSYFGVVGDEGHGHQREARGAGEGEAALPPRQPSLELTRSLLQLRGAQRFAPRARVTIKILAQDSDRNPVPIGRTSLRGIIVREH